MPFTICRDPGHPESSFRTWEEAVDVIRKLFEASLTERGELYIVETDRAGERVRVFSVDDEVAPTWAAGH